MGNLSHVILAMIVLITGTTVPNSNPSYSIDIDSKINSHPNTDWAVVAVSSPQTIITEKPSPTPSPVIKKTKSVPTYIPHSQGSCFDYVDTYAKKYGVDPHIMKKIIQAESGGNPLAKNAYSTASGCGQFIRSTWAGTLRQMGREWVSPFNAQVNVEAMAFKISRGGISAWNASRSKWGN